MLKPLFWSDGPIKILGIEIDTNWEHTHYLNYDCALVKMEGILNSWHNRILTPIGKIMVINTLISSMLVHKFMCLPSPNEAFFRKYKEMITSFLWNSKTPKIRYSKIVQDYVNNSLKLVDLKTRDLALKASWVTRWKTAERLESAELDWVYINLPVTDYSIWHINMSPHDLKKLFFIHNRHGIPDF